MGKVMIGVDKKQLESAVKQLSRNEKLKLLKRLERETRKERWNKLVSKIRRRYAKNPITDEEIAQICEEVRQERYERTIKSSD